MTITIQMYNGYTILTPQLKTLNLAECDTLKSLIQELILQDVNQLVINLENIEYIDSIGLGCFVFIQKAVNNKNGDVAFCNCQNSVLKIFTQTKTDQVIRIASTIEDAVVSMRYKNGN